jgi:hypothetical protein
MGDIEHGVVTPSAFLCPKMKQVDARSERANGHNSSVILSSQIAGEDVSE